MVTKKRSTGKMQAKKPSKEQARVWVQRLLPITLRHLDVEGAGVEERRWRWRHYNRRCECFARIRDALGPRYLGTFEQYLRYRPAAIDLANAHDTALDELVAMLGSAFDRLCENPLFREKVEAAEREHGAFSEAELQHDIKQMAQHTINNVVDLLPSEALEKVWSAARDGLREVAGAELRQVERKGEAFGDAVRALTKALREDQAALADQFNIPVIDATDDSADGYSTFGSIRDRADRLSR
jgi:hypothetical protein